MLNKIATKIFHFTVITQVLVMGDFPFSKTHGNGALVFSIFYESEFFSYPIYSECPLIGGQARPLNDLHIKKRFQYVFSVFSVCYILGVFSVFSGCYLFSVCFLDVFSVFSGCFLNIFSFLDVFSVFAGCFLGVGYIYCYSHIMI